MEAQSRLRSWIAALRSAKELARVREIHALAAATGNYDVSSVYLANSLVSSYGRLGSMLEARSLFERMEFHTVVSWNSLIHGYVHNADYSTALDRFGDMLDRGFGPDARTLVLAIKACAGSGRSYGSSKRCGNGIGRASSCSSSNFVGLERVMALHSLVERSGYGEDLYLLNTLVAVYGKLGSLVDAKRVFDGIKCPDVVSCNAMIQNYVDSFRGDRALELFRCCPMVDPHSFVAAIKACSYLERGGNDLALETGIALHARAADNGLACDGFVGSSLIDMYSEFSRMEDARRVFVGIFSKDVVSWTSLIFGYAQNGDPELALDLFQEMQQAGTAPTSQTFVAAINACSVLATRSNSKPDFVTLERGMALHSRSLAQDRCNKIFIATSLVNFYSNSGSMIDAQRVFDKMPAFHHSSALWNALMLGYVGNGDLELVLDLFQRLELHHQPNPRNFTCGFKACGSSTDLSTGKNLHSKVCRAGFLDKPDSILTTSMIDFYTKCGSVVDAQHLFESQVYVTKTDSTIARTALMTGYSRKGDASRVLEIYSEMEAEGIEPSSVTLLSVLQACNHAGRPDEAKRLFAAMADKYGIDPAIEHYDCLIDAVARADDVGQALEVAENMPVEADAATWKTLLGACCKRKDAVLGKMAFELLIEKDQHSVVEAYTLMANIYS